ncbi:MAG: type III pantothenate kinase [Saprospiraceae bacterium]|jgi:type III pantothenate kinase
MFLATDIGNSNIVIAIHNGKEWTHNYRYETKDYHPELFYETGIRDILLEWGILPSEINGAAVSSVVPEVTERIMEALTNNIRFLPVLLNPELFIKLDMRIPKVYEIGSDLVANAVAASHMYQQNCIVVDFGTALTFTVYEHSVGITGVTIAPGLKTIISTLSDSTSLLPEIDIDIPDSAIGKSTSTAIRAGVLFGFIGMVKEILSRMKAELDNSYKIVATGGLSSVIKELNTEYDEINKNLTLDGIRILAQNETK